MEIISTILTEQILINAKTTSLGLNVTFRYERVAPNKDILFTAVVTDPNNINTQGNTWTVTLNPDNKFSLNIYNTDNLMALIPAITEIQSELLSLKASL